MFMGHYAAAIAVKFADPKAPLWVYVGAAQLLDIIWATFVLIGIERIRFDYDLPGSVLVLEYMPWSHSLLFALGWALTVFLVARNLGQSIKTSLLIGLVVLSHWIFDLFVHRPDLALWPAGPVVGFALWNSPVVEEAIEVGFLGISSVAWAGSRGRQGQSIWPVVGFLAFCCFMQIAVLLIPPPPSPNALVLNALLVFSFMPVFAAYLAAIMHSFDVLGTTVVAVG